MARIRRAFYKVLFSRKSFEMFQRHGINVTRHHFYNPIPDTRALDADETLWEGEAELAGVDLNVEKQLQMLSDVFSEIPA